MALPPLAAKTSMEVKQEYQQKHQEQPHLPPARSFSANVVQLQARAASQHVIKYLLCL